MNKIREDLWITDIKAAQTHEIPTEAVVSVCQDHICDNVSENTDYMHFYMSDGEGEYGGICNYEMVKTAANYVFDKIACEEKSVLVHCHAGQSRSATVCICVLSRLEGLTYDESYNRVKAVRGQIRPNKELESYAKQYVNKYGPTHTLRGP